jgi:hypothetical protein
VAEAMVSCVDYFYEGLDVHQELVRDPDFLHVVAVVVGKRGDHASTLPCQSEHCNQINKENYAQVRYE